MSQLLPTSHAGETDGRSGQGEGGLGTLVPNAPRLKYQHQDGSWNRGLSTY